MCFWRNKETKQNNQTYKLLPRTGIEPETSRTLRGCVTSATPSQMRVTIVVKYLTVSTQWVET